MNRYELEVFANRRYGNHIGWMANVINTSHSNPTTKIKGLLYLAFHDMVCACSGTMDLILIDGFAVNWSELEKYAAKYNEEENLMRLNITEVTNKTVYTLSEAKLDLDSYHQNIQNAAKMLLDAGDYGDYTYQTSLQSGNSYWKSPDWSEVVCADLAAGAIVRYDLVDRKPSVEN